MKKVLAFVLALVLALSLFGCDIDNTQSQTPSSSDTQSVDNSSNTESDEIKEVREIIEPLHEKAFAFYVLTKHSAPAFDRNNFPNIWINGREYIEFDLDKISTVDEYYKRLKDLGVKNWKSLKDIEDSILEIYISKEESGLWSYFEYVFAEKDGKLYCLWEPGDGFVTHIWDFHTFEIVSKSEDKIVIKANYENFVGEIKSGELNIIKNENGEWVFDESYKGQQE